jgi:hypothetical protein
MVIAPITADQNHLVDSVSYDYEFQNMKACSQNAPLTTLVKFDPDVMKEGHGFSHGCH